MKKWNIGNLWKKYKYVGRVVLAGILLMLLPGKKTAADPQEMTPKALASSAVEIIGAITHTFASVAASALASASSWCSSTSGSRRVVR